MDDIKLLVGRFIELKRNQEKLKQEDLAKKADVSRATLWKVEAGEANLSLETFERILKALNTNFYEFAQFVKPVNLNNEISKLSVSDSDKEIINSLIRSE